MSPPHRVLPSLQGPRVLLRALHLADAHSLSLHAKSPDVSRFLRDAFPDPYSLAHARDFIRRVHHEREWVWALVVNGEAVGCVGANPGNDIHQLNVEVGYWLGQSLWGQGLATEALTLLLNHLAHQRRYRRLWASVFAHNRASIRVLEKCGLQHEATFRQNLLKNGRLHDECIYARYL